MAHDEMNEVIDLDEEVNNKTITGLHLHSNIFWNMTLEEGESRDDD